MNFDIKKNADGLFVITDCEITFDGKTSFGKSPKTGERMGTCEQRVVANLNGTLVEHLITRAVKNVWITKQGKMRRACSICVEGTKTVDFIPSVKAFVKRWTDVGITLDANSFVEREKLTTFDRIERALDTLTERDKLALIARLRADVEGSENVG